MSEPITLHIEPIQAEKIYVASSWRNDAQQGVVHTLRTAGFDVYDFKHPKPGDDGFHWSEIDPAWQSWTPEQYIKALEHPVAEDGFKSDMDALVWADTCVLVMPCGRSAHLELGYAIGAGHNTAILLSDAEPELMYKMADLVTPSMMELLEWLGVED